MTTNLVTGTIIVPWILLSDFYPVSYVLACVNRCHCESGTPNFLYPCMEFTREYGIPIHDSLVNCVWGYLIPVVHFVSSYVSPTWILYPLLTRRLRYNDQVETSTSANDLESWKKGELFLWERLNCVQY